MELIHIYLSVALIWAIAVVTPGPNFFITVRTAIGVSRKSALLTVAGITTGTLAWGVCGFFGIHLLFKAAPWLYSGLKILGGSYLVFLGIRLTLSASKGGFDATGQVPSGRNHFKSFRLGLLTNLSNPKTAAFVASLFAATISSNTSLFTGLTTIALMGSLSMTWYSLVAIIFSMDRFRDLYRRKSKWIERTAGMIFIGFGLKLATGK